MDPEPDYFHHWVRDAAIAIRLFPDVITSVGPGDAPWWRQAFTDHVAFSLALSDPSRRGPDSNPLKDSARADHLRFLRDDNDLRSLTGRAWLGEPRFAPDGSPDLERWSRPQDDGPALRASAILRVTDALPDLADARTARLIERDLDWTCAVAGRPCIGPWEEEPPRRATFTLIAQWDALTRGATRCRAIAQSQQAESYERAATGLLDLILTAADPAEPAWRESIEAPAGHFDGSVLLAILDADRGEGPLALNAARTLGTSRALERLFAQTYPVSTGWPVPAMGRWRDDVFFGGNPWFPVILGCAELHYRIAAIDGATWAFDKAEAWMAMVEAFAPPGDAIPEQFDRATGAPTSCLGLTWSAAAFIAAAAARDAACQAIGSR